MTWLFKNMFFQNWMTSIIQKKQTLDKIKGRFGSDQLQRVTRQLFVSWKMETLNELIWKQGKEVAFLEQQLDFVTQDDPEKVFPSPPEKSYLVKVLFLICLLKTSFL